MSHSQRHDVIIIGTGAGGGTLARHLAPSGERIAGDTEASLCLWRDALGFRIARTSAAGDPEVAPP